MLKSLQFFLLVIFLGSVSNLDAQERRYLDPVFDDVEVSPVQFAGSNFTVLPWIFAAIQGQQGNILRQPLAFQTYTPTGDTEEARPLVIYVHTGNFFPFPQNGSCGGTIQDSTAVEISTRLAKMGYVVASVDYRQGWLATHPEELVRRFSLINASYRGVQDINTYVRYFKKTVAEFGNPLNIDPEKIVIWGQGTGGYISLGAAFLNEQSELVNTGDPNKFLLPTPAGPIPMVIEGYNGDINGTNDFNGNMPTFVDATYNAVSQLPLGDTLSVPNHVGYSSEFQLAVNMGGAAGDTTWIDEGEVPLVSFHTVSDAFAPYTTDVLLVPTATGPQPVVEVSGSYDIHKIISETSNNDIFNTIPVGGDPIGDAINSEFVGLFPFTGTPEDSGAPWEWTDLDNPDLIAEDCNGNAASSRTYIDSIIGYYAPRGCVALQLECDFTSSTENLLDENTFAVSPNPASDFINITSSDLNYTSVELYNIAGKLIEVQKGTKRNSSSINVAHLNSGIYLVKVYFDEGIATKRVVIQ